MKKAQIKCLMKLTSGNIKMSRGALPVSPNDILGKESQN